MMTKARRPVVGSGVPAAAAPMKIKPRAQVLASKNCGPEAMIKRLKSPSAYSLESLDDDDDSSTGSNVSAEYRPLAFGFIKGCPVRKRGAPAVESDFSARSKCLEECEQESLSLSDDERPLQVSLTKDGPKRYCGGIDTKYENDELSMPEINNVALVSPLDAHLIGGGKRRKVGYDRNGRAPEYSYSEKVSSISDDDEEDEKPLNAEVILNLVRRLRAEPHAEIHLETFQWVNWGDENFQEALVPLRQVFEFMEAKAHKVSKLNETKLEKSQATTYDKKIKEAIFGLPPEKTIVAKIAQIKRKALESSVCGSIMYQGGESGDETRAALPQRSTKAAKPIDTAIQPKKRKATKQKESSFSETCMSASHSHIYKMNNSILITSKPSRAVKEGQFGEAAKKLRRKRIANRSTTFDDVAVPKTGEEIVEGQGEHDLTPSVHLSGEKPLLHDVDQTNHANTIQVPKTVRRERAKRGGSTSFLPVPDMDAPEDVKDDGKDLINSDASTKRVERRQRRKQRPNRSITFTDLVVEEAGEVIEGVTGACVTANDAEAPYATATSASRKKSVKPQRMNKSRSLDFSEVVDESGEELREENTVLDKGKRPIAHNPDRTNNATPKLKRTYRPHSREVSMSELNVGKAGEIFEPHEELLCPKSSMHGSRPNTRPGARSVTPSSRKALGRSSSILAVDVGTVEGLRIVDDMEQDGINSEPPNCAIPRPPSNPTSNTARRGNPKRKQRKFISQELSISALPDDIAGEVLENDALVLNSKPGSRLAQAMQISKPVAMLPALNGTTGSNPRRAGSVPAHTMMINNTKGRFMADGDEGNKGAVTTPPTLKTGPQCQGIPRAPAKPRQATSMQR